MHLIILDKINDDIASINTVRDTDNKKDAKDMAILITLVKWPRMFVGTEINLEKMHTILHPHN